MLETLTDNQCRWLRSGADDDVVLSCRVRLARNIAGYPFLTRADDREVARIEELLRSKIMGLPPHADLEYHRLDGMDSVLRQLLVERHLIGQDHADADWERGVAFASDESMSLLVNEEDHLRMQVFGAGLSLETAWEGVRELDEALAQIIPFAFSARYGYLTACPTNVGTGMRAGVMVHLPALVMAREMEKVIQLCQDSDLALRGLYGEGSHAAADLYQLSNQVTLGRKEEEIISGVDAAVRRIIEREREARRQFFHQDQPQLTGRVKRALELLRSATRLSSEESLNLLSQVRLGAELDLLDGITPEGVNRLLLLTLPAHLQTIEGRETDRQRRNALRAEYLRKQLVN